MSACEPSGAESVEAQEECWIVPIHMANQAAASRIEIKHRELNITFMGEASPDALKAVAEALPTDKELLPTSAAAKGVELCNEIFLLERELEGKDVNGRITQEPLTPQQRYTQRQERLKPLLDDLFVWLSSLSVSGGTKLAKAVQYCLNEKQYLYRCLEDGNVPVDNNRAENAIRPFVVGRKNWLFSNVVKGAKASAVIYSLAVIATANGLNVEEYFTRLCRGQLLLPQGT